MKWIQQVLWKIQSGHESVHRQMERQTDGETDRNGETSVSPFIMMVNFTSMILNLMYLYVSIYL